MVKQGQQNDGVGIQTSFYGMSLRCPCTAVQIGPFAAFKQWIADSIAGDYDVAKITARVDDTINSNTVVPPIV